MHSMIIGMTESGKSTLAKLLAKSLHTCNKNVAVLDPLLDPDWKCSYHTDDIDDMQEYLQKNRSVYLFVDESGTYFNEGNDMSEHSLATRSRHYGHSVTFIAQRAIQIPKTMRDQCNRLYLFTSSKTDGKIHSEEWNKTELEQCNTLPKLHFYQCGRYDKLTMMRIVNYKDVQIVHGRNSNINIDTNRSSDDGNKRRKVGKTAGDVRH